MAQGDWSSEAVVVQDVDEREQAESESPHPGKPPYLMQVNMFWSAHHERIKNSLLSFAAWMGGAELTLIVIVVLLTYGSSPFSSFTETVGIIYWAGIAGAALGVVPAILAAVVVATRGKRPSLWVLGAASIPVTFGTVLLMLMNIR